jgi:hypothetical protein
LFFRPHKLDFVKWPRDPGGRWIFPSRQQGQFITDKSGIKCRKFGITKDILAWRRY